MRGFEKIENLLRIEHGIIQAPMAGGTTTPELVAAVSAAGALGSLGCAYMAPDQIAGAIRRVRELTNRPFAVNLFAGGADGSGEENPTRIIELLTPYFERLGLEPPQAPEPRPIRFDRQLEVIIDENVSIFSFTFGIPDPPFLKTLKEKKMIIMGTATTVAEARALAAAGAGAVVAQGSEAGAHRGSFMRPLEQSLVGGLALVPQIADAVSLPVVASGGIMDGRGIVAACALGAAGVQMGTAFLTCAESGASQAHKDAVCAASDDATTLTRAFSGRLARGIANSFIDQLEPSKSAFLSFPLQNSLTRPMRTAATKRGDTGYMSLWAGQAASLARQLPAGDLVKRLIAEVDETLARMNA